MTAKTTKSFLSDQETVVDLLYYEPIAKTVVKFVRQDPSSPITIGVHGDWGAGKSSVLKMTEAALKQDERTRCLWFNGWMFEGFEDAKTVVLETIITELLRSKTITEKAKAAGKKLFKRIQWLKIARKAGGLAVTAVTGIPPPDMVGALLEKVTKLATNPTGSIDTETLKELGGDAGEFLKASEPSENSIPEHMHAFRGEFEELLNETDIDQLVVMIDDLDRCLPETAIATLEAIRLFLFVPRTAFVVGADEAMIEYSVKRHFPDLTVVPGAANYTRNYLEKLIHVPFRIPALGPAETRTYITLLMAQSAMGSDDDKFNKLLNAAREDLKRPWQSRGLDRTAIAKALKDIPGEIEQAMTISLQITKALTDGTRGNPRQIKRFLNSMTLRHAIAEARGFADDIELPVLAKVMLAERFAVDLYEQLARFATDSASGTVPLLNTLEVEVLEGKPEPPVKPDVKDGKTASLPKEVEEWKKDEWISAWAKIEPRIGQLDLRPYFFLTRDKRSFYAGGLTADHLDLLVDRLMGDSMTVTSAVGDIKKLPDSDAKQVFDALKARVQSADKLSAEPPGVEGITALVKNRPALQAALIQFIKELPEDQVGAWIATKLANAFTTPEMRVTFRQMLEVWDTSSKNKLLKSAAKMTLVAFKG
jgi:hypothetical protein